MKQFMVGRQPIFDTSLNVFGYELLFRSPSNDAVSGDSMTADVLVHAGLDVGLSGLVGTKYAFINATRAFLVGEQEIPLPPEQTVIEVLEAVAVDSAVVEGCRRLVADGYSLALDDYVGGDGRDELLSLAKIVKLDVLAIPAEDLAAQVEHCAPYGGTLLAEKVETREQLEACRRLGIELFQGYLLSRPEVVTGSTLSPSRLACLQLINRLCDPDISAKELERLVEADAGLSHRFLRAAGTGAASGLRRPVSSIREGVVLLGIRRLRNWVTLMLLADARDGSSEMLTIGMTRARMCELLASAVAPDRRDSAFTVGLVSALDVLLSTSLSDIVANLTITDELVDALLAHAGPLGSILRDVLVWEFGGQNLELRSGLDLATVEKSYLDALSWAIEITSILDPRAHA